MNVTGTTEATKRDAPAGRLKALVRRSRWQWLLERAKEERFIDVLNADLVEAYITDFRPSFRPTCWGAHKCRQLGADLSAMAKLGYLKRHRTGLSSGAWQPGFPKWVWSYQPGKNAALLEPNGLGEARAD